MVTIDSLCELISAPFDGIIWLGVPI